MQGNLIIICVVTEEDIKTRPGLAMLRILWNYKPIANILGAHFLFATTDCVQNCPLLFLLYLENDFVLGLCVVLFCHLSSMKYPINVIVCFFQISSRKKLWLHSRVVYMQV